MLAGDLDGAAHERLAIGKPSETRLKRCVGEDELTQLHEAFAHLVESCLTAGEAKGSIRKVTASDAQGPVERPRVLSRSDFLKTGAVAAAAVGSGPLAQSAAASSGKDALAYLRLATYRKLTGQVFELHHPHGPIPVRLNDVTNLDERGARERARRESFSLLFEAQRSEPLFQGTYHLEHRTLGKFSLFLVPVGRGEKGFFLEAVVNRWLDASHP